MARYTGPVCKLCRREGKKLFLKGERCNSVKCSFETKSYVPGQHGSQTARRRLSNYGVQLREKQKIKRIYGLLEKQFRHYFELANSQKGVTGTNLMKILERRLDNVVYRLGFASSRRMARELVSHQHFTVNNRSVDIPSYQLKAGDVIQVRDKSKKLQVIHDSMKRIRGEHELPWLILDKAKMQGIFIQVPERDQMNVDVNEQLVVELYSK
ncbi:MAG: 30S ribosomal protein S4 [Candidatus Marinimicrobia bacterium]|jgi:small subunit ribosomal protein S4|nr:30S ribosomal protein S4 [Candidatus Neomarinimicrobiota bacterium]MCK9482893.1 30S ribosomal protein S4 [Candidatus Neomarinimicrobiota bacterium]MCK9559445.1 30S ribosomal protein S4 [Candidatus Neomarinimicrobiota bacterium]MDD5061147.1 30S ribosomal protein S4 [Candidatus Neomarinimicrobiota bacterium]MDD5230133.1 30S ribosomal protein S4 [Candidatus Neomarinimicrobiota bacterium]